MLRYVRHLENARRHVDCWTGYVDSQEKFDKFMRYLAAKKVILKALTAKEYPCIKERLRQCPRSDHVFIDEDMPFTVVATAWLWQPCCDIEIDPESVRNTECGEKEETDWFAAILMKHDNCRGAELIRRPAMMYIKQVDMYPEFRVPFLTKYSTSRGREAAIKETLWRLKQALHKESVWKPLLRHQRFYIKMCDKITSFNDDEDYCCEKHVPASMTIMQDQMQSATNKNFLTYWIKECAEQAANRLNHDMDSCCEEQPANMKVMQNQMQSAQTNTPLLETNENCFTSSIKECAEQPANHLNHDTDSCCEEQPANISVMQNQVQLAQTDMSLLATNENCSTYCIKECTEQPADHSNHNTESCCNKQPANMNIMQNQMQVAQTNVPLPATKGNCLTYCVKEVLLAGDLNLKTKCKYFDATKETIQDILRRALLKDEFSSIVQEDIACFVNELHEKWPETGRHFKPMELKCNVLRTVASECKDVLRRCANTNFVAHLMHKHSEIVICIEMALCGTDYVLPAFLLGFKTPMHHALAGVFLIDFEMLDCMAKAFDLFKARDPYAAITKFWIVEHSEAEINALSSMFPDSRPLLCNFHRAISWSEWQPTTSSDARDISFIKEMLQKVTCSKSDDERRSVLEMLEQSPHWQRNKRLQNYVYQKWLLVVEMLAENQGQAFCFGDLIAHPGTESSKAQSCLAKYCSHRARGLVRVFTKKFSPNNKPQAVQASANSMHPLHLSALPTCAHSETVNGAKQSGQGLAEASLCKKNSTLSVPSCVQSSTFDKVNVNIISCSCSEFKAGPPCQHIKEMFSLAEGQDISRVLAAYQNRPHVTANANTDPVLQQMIMKASREAFRNVKPNKPLAAVPENINCLLKTVSDASVLIKAELNEPQVTAHGTADCSAQGGNRNAEVIETCVKAEPNEPNMTARENISFTGQEEISEASEIEVSIKGELNEGHVEAHAEHGVAQATPLNVELNEVLLTSHQDADIAPCIKAEPNDQSMTAHEDVDRMSQEETSKASKLQVCINVEPKEAQVEASGGAYYVLQELTSTASGMASFVTTEPNETGMTVPEGTEFVLQENITKASKWEACIKVKPTEAKAVSDAPEMSTCFEVEPIEMCLVASEDAACASSPLAGNKALDIETCVKLRSNEPFMAGCDDTNCVLQEKLSETPETKAFVKDEPYLTFNEDTDGALQETSRTSDIDMCVKFEPNETLDKGTDNSFPTTVSNALIHIEAQATVLDVKAHEDRARALRETSKSPETIDCFEVERDSEPAELPVEVCSRDLEQGNPRQSTLCAKSQVRARMEEVNSVRCVRDAAVLQQELVDANQTTVPVERSMSGCSGAGDGRRTAYGDIGTKRKMTASTRSTKKRK